MRLVPILFGAVLLLPECGRVATDDGGREQGTPEIPMDDPVAVGEAGCRRAARCTDGSPFLRYPGGTLESCLASVSCLAEEWRTRGYRVGCALAMDELPCDQSIQEACMLVGESTLRRGEPCTHDQGAPRCLPGLYCPPEFDGCSVCEPLAHLGEACDEGRTLDGDGKLISDPPCSDEFICSTETRRCVRRPAVGEPCARQGECKKARCLEGLCVAIPPQNSPLGGPCTAASDCAIGYDGLCFKGVCSLLADVGEPCDASVWSCREGLVCTEGTCAAVPCGRGGEGDLCLRHCREGLHCEEATHRCRARLAERETCAYDDCLEGLVCEALVKKCIRPKALGEPCVGHTDCESGHCPSLDHPDAVCEEARVCE